MNGPAFVFSAEVSGIVEDGQLFKQILHELIESGKVMTWTSRVLVLLAIVVVVIVIEMDSFTHDSKSCLSSLYFFRFKKKIRLVKRQEEIWSSR